MPQIRNTLRPDIRVLLYSKDIPLTKVARECEIDISAVSRALRGKQSASPRILAGLSRILGLPESYLSTPTIVKGRRKKVNTENIDRTESAVQPKNPGILDKGGRNERERVSQGGFSYGERS